MKADKKLAMRQGLRICGQRGDPEVRAALIPFARWLRSHYEFPIRVPVYLRPEELLVTRDGQKASASFLAPWDRNVEPYIRIATGEYPQMVKTMSRDNALATHMHSLGHEVVHYLQWVETGEVWEQGVVNRAEAMLRKYIEATGFGS